MSDGKSVSEDSHDVSTAVRYPSSVKSVQEEMSRIRGLPVKNDISVAYLDRDQLKEKLKEEINKSMPPEELAAEEKLLTALGLLEQGADLNELVSKMLGEEIAGYYDDESKELAVISDGGAGATLMDEVTLSHEITHALQDQNFDLLRLIPTEGTGNSDMDLARLALVEGDASMAMTMYMQNKMSAIELLSLGFGSMGAATDTAAMPAFLESQLMFPYIDGEAFVTYIMNGSGWDQVNAAYQNPPESTEQIMHPEKYLAREHPVTVILPDFTGVIGAEWEPGEGEVLGEFDTRTILSENMPDSQAAGAAAGWGGGIYKYYLRTDGAMMLVMLFAWDSPGDASEFSAVMGESLEKRYGEEFVFAEGQAPLLNSRDGAWSLEQHGDNVVVVLAPEASQAKSVADKSVGL